MKPLPVTLAELKTSPNRDWYDRRDQLMLLLEAFISGASVKECTDALGGNPFPCQLFDFLRNK